MNTWTRSQGQPGVNLDGGGESVNGPGGSLRRVYVRGSRCFVQARANGWIDPLPPLRPAPLAAVREAEALAGMQLPTLLRRLYLEVGNGGFGPGYGLLGLRGGHTMGRINALTGLDRPAVDPDVSPRRLMIVCEWGCGIGT